MNPGETVSESLHEMMRYMYVPTGLFPAEIRASFTSVIIEPVTGAEHDVPNTSSNSPSIPRHRQYASERVRTVKY